jgi:rhodanese-related sulfurtransferase
MFRPALLLALFVVSAATSASAKDHTTDSLDVVKKNLAEKKAVLVDVREAREWNKGHLKDAQLQPLSVLDKATTDAAIREKLAKELPKDRIIYCHCAKGARAQTAGDILTELGYDVRPLAAGFDELTKQGFQKAEPVDAK